MCNTGLLKAGATYRANNPPHQNEALHVHAHTCPPPEEYTLLLSCSYCDVFSDRSTNFLLSFVWPGFEPAPLVGAPFFRSAPGAGLRTRALLLFVPFLTLPPRGELFFTTSGSRTRDRGYLSRNIVCWRRPCVVPS